jgi:hypothetical protein
MKMAEPVIALFVVIGMVLAAVVVSKPLRRRREVDNVPVCPICSGVGMESGSCFFCGAKMVEVEM